MKRFLVFIVLLVVCTSSVCSAFGMESEYDFKKFKWGATIEEVINVEGEPVGKRSDTENKVQQVLSYDRKALDNQTILNYTFSKDGLFNVSYVVCEWIVDPNKNIEIYNKWVTEIERKYGPPIVNKELWVSTDIRNKMYEDMGTALDEGFVSLLSVFETSTTKIIVNLQGGKKSASRVVIDYTSLEIDPPILPSDDL